MLITKRLVRQFYITETNCLKLRFGEKVKESTKYATNNCDVAVATDHRAGPSKETFSTITMQRIDNSWQLNRGTMDFKIYKGRSTGDKINEGLKKVFAANNLYIDNCTIVITDTTGSQGKLGQFLLQNGYKYAYYIDHNFQLNAKLVFDDKYIPGANGVMKKHAV